MTDWKGNEIKEGMTIIRVVTKPLFNNIQPMFSFLAEDGARTEWKKIGNPVHTPDHIWEIQFESVVEKHNTVFVLDGKSCQKEHLYYKIDNYFFEVSMLDMGQPSDITCIKGVSDSEKDYYEWYFSHV